MKEKGLDLQLWIRRLILIGAALGFGFAVTWFIVYAKITIPVIYEPSTQWSLTPFTIQGKQFTLDTTFADYGMTYTVLTISSFAVALGIWLDKFLKTEILPR